MCEDERTYRLSARVRRQLDTVVPVADRAVALYAAGCGRACRSARHHQQPTEEPKRSENATPDWHSCSPQRRSPEISNSG